MIHIHIHEILLMIGNGHETAFGQFGRVRSAFGESGETECQTGKNRKRFNEVAASGLAGRPGAMALAMAMQSSDTRSHMILHTNAANS